MDTRGQRETLRFGDFELETAACELRRKGRPVKLGRQPMDLLILLVERRGRLVSRADLVDRLWGKDVFVDVETGVNTAISKVRQALRDSPEKPAFVETVPGRGYRFIASVEAIVEPSGPALAQTTTPEPSITTATTSDAAPPVRRRTWTRTHVAVPALVALVGVVGWTWFAAGDPTTWYRLHSSAVDSTPTLAVVPFRSLPASTDADLLELGLADVFISRLGQLQNVRVLPLSATERLRSDDPSELARRLGATRVLTGTVQRDADRLRVSVQLRSLPDGRTIWADTFDTNGASIFIIQDSIVARLLEEIVPWLSADARTRLASAGTQNSDAFKAYLRGRAHASRATVSDLRRAIDLFQAALALDRTFTDGWAALAGAYRLLPIAAGASPAEAFLEARRAAERALQLDPTHAEALEVLGTIAFWDEWDYPKAERLLTRALTLQPSSVNGHRFLAHLFSNLGRHDEALVSIRRAQQFDPGSSPARALEGQFLFMARRYDESLAQFDRAIDVDRRFVNGRQMRVYALIALKRYEDALRECDAIDDLTSANSPRPYSWSLTLRGYTLARIGRSAEAEAALSTLRRQALEQYVPRHHEALLLHALGRDDEALHQLALAVDSHDVFVTFLGVDPKWDALRSSPAFRALAKRVNLLDVSDRVLRERSSFSAGR
jgi:DNA-binding winged helix-turn-helix (wHTH) protein/TolB-like protein/Flp pilus assembly protein TadD